jgi:excisionase family DNA binding protein
MSLAETAAYLGVSLWTVRELQSKGHLPRVNPTRKLLFDRTSTTSAGCFDHGYVDRPTTSSAKRKADG